MKFSRGMYILQNTGRINIDKNNFDHELTIKKKKKAHEDVVVFICDCFHLYTLFSPFSMLDGLA